MTEPRDERLLGAEDVVNAWLAHHAEILDKPVDQWPENLRDELIFGLTSREGLMFIAGYRKGFAARDALAPHEEIPDRDQTP